MNARFDRRVFLGAAAGTIACAGAPRAPNKRDDPYRSLRGLCEGEAPLSREEHRANQQRAQAQLQAKGYRALVVEPGATMFHLSGVRWWPSERPFLMVLRPQGPPQWIAPAFEATRALERAGADAQLLLWQEHEDPYALLAKSLSAKGPVAVEPQMRHFVVEGARRALGEVVSGASIVRALRMIKTPRELALLSRANRATKAALTYTRAKTAPGMRESQVRKIVLDAQRAAGLVDVWALVLFAQNAAFPHGSGKERVLREGDVVLIDTGGRLHGYCSDITRTWSCGRPSDEARRAWDTVQKAQAAAFSMLRPGVPCAEVDTAARAVLEKSGYGGGYERFWHRLGHGIGLRGHEHPYLVRGNTLKLQPGMTMSNEPGIYIAGKLGVRIEDIVAITEDGHTVFGPPTRPLWQA